MCGSDYYAAQEPASAASTEIDGTLYTHEATISLDESRVSCNIPPAVIDARWRSRTLIHKTCECDQNARRKVQHKLVNILYSLVKGRVS